MEHIAGKSSLNYNHFKEIQLTYENIILELLISNFRYPTIYEIDTWYLTSHKNTSESHEQLIGEHTKLNNYIIEHSNSVEQPLQQVQSSQQQLLTEDEYIRQCMEKIRPEKENLSKPKIINTSSGCVMEIVE